MIGYSRKEINYKIKSKLRTKKNDSQFKLGFSEILLIGALAVVVLLFIFL